ncbi:hypothetical protein NHX12_018327 [Muraenolepis orangiensis]|uniref:Uncharacterized protein n=1 Tax=Muraenolepis orangiensis TaxID=630683 RepID=A0A9Q0IV94_9TELE|nr:hypothetical protein NHX12_018327 [Muraenolepis orangiensis]
MLSSASRSSVKNLLRPGCDLASDSGTAGRVERQEESAVTIIIVFILVQVLVTEAEVKAGAQAVEGRDNR